MQRFDSAVKLTDEMLGRVKSLESACRSFDKTSSSISLAQELNFHKDMKSFFFAYDGDKLIGIVSVFAPVKGQAELSCLVLPENRRCGIFKALLRLALEELEMFGVGEVYLVHDAANSAGAAVLDKWKTKIDHSEFLLEYDKSHEAAQNSSSVIIKETFLKDIEGSVKLALNVFGGRHEEWTALFEKSYLSPNVRCFTAEHNGESAGLFCINETDKGIFIFSFGILPGSRGKGLGRAMLSKAVMLIISEYKDGIFLEVDSENTAAYSLYTTSGFSERVRFDYHKLEP